MRLRIYYNRFADFPLLWSYDKGTQETEVNIRDFVLRGVDVTPGMDLSVPAGDRERPRVWMEVQRVSWLSVENDVLTVFGRDK